MAGGVCVKSWNRMRLIGALMGFAESDLNAQSQIMALREALAKLGWMEGNNFRIELRWGAADPERIRTFAKELVGLRPDAILGQTTPVIGALAREPAGSLERRVRIGLSP